jgi:hypothetical protein
MLKALTSSTLSHTDTGVVAYRHISVAWIKKGHYTLAPEADMMPLSHALVQCHYHYFQRFRQKF